MSKAYLLIEVFKVIGVVDGLHHAIGIGLRRRRHIKVGNQHRRTELRTHMSTGATLAVAARSNLNRQQTDNRQKAKRVR